MTKFNSLYEDFSKALVRLEEILKEEKTDIVRDSAIKRFEIAFDLAWKTLKSYLENFHNITAASPRNCFREAFKIGIINYDEYWIKLTLTRNYTTHVYKENPAENVYKELPKLNHQTPVWGSLH